MKASDIPRLRLVAQGLIGNRAGSPAEVVRHLGALQAQDLGQSLWAIGSRVRDGTLAGVERAIDEGSVVRSWPMRGTIHAMAAEDVRWMVALAAPRVIAADARRLAELELTEADVARATELVLGALDGRGPVPRSELTAVFEAAGIATTGQRGYHLLWRVAQDGHIALGPLAGRQQTFVRMDDWVPPSPMPAGDEALARLAGRFAVSRGPVTAHDLARWSGLTVTAARRGLTGHPDLVTEEVDGTTYWLSGEVRDAPAARGWRRPLLLAGFDEYLIGYKDRDDVIDPGHFEKVVPGRNGVFKPMVVVAGRIVGTWKRELTARRFRVEVAPFEPGAVELAGLDAAVRGYRDFLDLPPTVRPEPPTLAA